MSELFALGVSHKTAPLGLRERLALTEGRAAGLIGELAGSGPITEAAAVSTCNRTEVYLVVTDPVEAESATLAALSRHAGIRPTELIESLYSRRGEAAAQHLFEVAAGLDSMILGEAEIQGQVKRAYELALVEGATGPILNRLFRGALAAGKRVREETRIGEGNVSVPSAAVQLATGHLGDLSSRKVLLIGAGETAELCARALAARGAAAVFVANRHHDRAIGLASRFGGEAIRLDDLPGELARADIVVSSTHSPHHIVGREELELVVAERAARPLLLIDLAVPRDIDPGCREVGGVTLYDVDDVQTVADRAVSGREAEVKRAGTILASELGRFSRWLDSLEVVPTIAAMQERAQEVVQRVLAENRGRWQELSDADRQRMDRMAAAIATRILHEPTLQLKRAAEREDAYLQIAALRQLFGLDATAEPEAGEAEVTPIRREGRAGRAR